MAGYRHKRKRITIVFEEGHEYHGLEVTLRGMSLGGFLEIQGIGEVDKSSIADQLRRFAESLIEWNLEDEDGGAVPTTVEAVYEQDQELMFLLATKWIDALRGVVSAPLEQSSPDGEPSQLEASIPMDAVSSPLAS